MRSNPPGDATKPARATAFLGKNHSARNVALSCRKAPRVPVICKSKEKIVTRLSDGLAVYRICVKAEGESPWTIRWVTTSVGYFGKFLGGDADISSITPNDQPLLYHNLIL